MCLIYKLINTKATGAPGMAQNHAVGLLSPYCKESCLSPLFRLFPFNCMLHWFEIDWQPVKLPPPPQSVVNYFLFSDGLQTAFYQHETKAAVFKSS